MADRDGLTVGARRLPWGAIRGVKAERTGRHVCAGLVTTDADEVVVPAHEVPDHPVLVALWRRESVR